MHFAELGTFEAKASDETFHCRTAAVRGIGPDRPGDRRHAQMTAR
jgi:hypothetical protein